MTSKAKPNPKHLVQGSCCKNPSFNFIDLATDNNNVGSYRQERRPPSLGRVDASDQSAGCGSGAGAAN